MSMNMRPLVEHVMQSLLHNDNSASVDSVIAILLQPGENDISRVSEPRVLQAKILEAMAVLMAKKAHLINQIIPVAPELQNRTIQGFKQRLSLMASNTPVANQLCSVAEFFYFFIVEIAGPDSACLASAIASTLLQSLSLSDLVHKLDDAMYLLTDIARKLEDLQAKVTQVAMEMYQQCEYMTADQLKQRLACHYQYYTVDTMTGTVNVHVNTHEESFSGSLFRVHLVDSFGKLVRLLQHLEQACNPYYHNGHNHFLAVDFEGVKLCRNGPLCLVQLTCSDDPMLVYVLDVHVLGKRAFSLHTQAGTSMKGLLENERVLKVWFDPRNDIDALFHQFDIFPRGIFDLQLAEVAVRRSRGLQVNYVQGLGKCLGQCEALSTEQKTFAEKINGLGKALFEPSYGGDYAVFQKRPLDPVILVYAAHDARHMLALYEQYSVTLGSPQAGHNWIDRVMAAGEERAKWCLTEEYSNPTSEAPDI